MSEIYHGIVLELEAFPRAVEVAQAIQKKVPILSPWYKKLLGKASTVVGSVTDIGSDFNPFVKAGLTMFREGCDLFKGE